MRRTVCRAVAVVLLLAGLVVLLLPQVFQQRFNYVTRQVVRDFEQAIAEEAGQMEKLYQRLVEENRRLYLQNQQDLYDPFSFEQPGIDLSGYGLPDNIIGYLEIPRLEEQLPIYLGANTEIME